MEFLIISGLSGGGKSRAADVLEDLDFYCVDNMPVALIPRFAELCLATKGRYERVALVTDIRSGYSFPELFEAIEEMQRMGCEHKILFIEATEETIINRYKETRRPHPLDAEASGVGEAVKLERERLAPIRERADVIIDTTGLTLSQLRRELIKHFSAEPEEKSFEVVVVSFGFKYGVPIEADLMFDVRFLPNPYYDVNLRHLCGLDDEVKSFIYKFPQTFEFEQKLTELLTFLLPHYIEEGKSSLTIAFGCTGGRHRSVAIAQAVGEFIAMKGYRCEIAHRDITRS